MNDLFVALGIEGWKQVLRSLLFPPMPFFALMLAGAWTTRRRPRLGWTLFGAGLAATWAMCTAGVGEALLRALTKPPAPLGATAIKDLARGPKTVIVVLGAGRRLLAPEYGDAEPSSYAVERLRYGAFLARQTGQPLAFSGGLAYGADPGPTEAEAARRAAARDFGLRLAWVEDRSRDTNENAIRTVAIAREQGIERIVVVTHGFHMRRSLAAFERAVGRRSGRPIELVAAPMGLPTPPEPGTFAPGDWLPSVEGFTATRLALHEWIGRLAGA